MSMRVPYVVKKLLKNIFLVNSTQMIKTNDFIVNEHYSAFLFNLFEKVQQQTVNTRTHVISLTCLKMPPAI